MEATHCLTDSDIDELRQYFSSSQVAPIRNRPIDLSWTRMKLGQWGRSSSAHGLGYPSMSTTEKARIGRGGNGSGGPSLPPDLEDIDLVVARSPRKLKAVLIEAYTKRGTTRQHAARLGFSVGDYWRRRTRAEVYVSQRLQFLERKL
jgi:hypothetical protein